MAWIKKLPLIAFALTFLVGCDSKLDSTVDQNLKARVDTLEDCFPNLFREAQALLAISDTWRQRGDESQPDPAGLAVSAVSPAGAPTVLSVTYSRPGSAVIVSMDIRFFGPAGEPQDIFAEVDPPATVRAKIRAAANELRDRFNGQRPFMVGDYTISGGGLTGADSLTGIIGGSTNQNELEELRTTADSSTINGGVPATDSATITDAGPPQCTLTFTIPGLLTDETPTQQYPIGVINLVITGPDATVTATITFDGSATARIVVTDVPGSFNFNVETRTLTFVP